ncbi:MAG: GGDEF domain-containing protein [Ketobacteraceae bacterium]|nr:GGDEF domain-containing protein [Ketobacteraceae bacterium]
MGVIYNKNTRTLVNPMDWSGVDRVMLSALAIAPWDLLQAALGFFLVAHPDVIPFLDTGVLEALSYYLLGCGALWLIVLGIAIYLRRYQEHNELLEWLVLLLPIPLILPIASAYGILTSSVLSAIVAISMLGFFLFETRKMLVTVFLSFILIVVAIALAMTGLIPVKPLYREVAMGPGAYWWMGGQLLITIYPLFCGILMTMFFLKGLRAREDKIRELSRRDGLTNVWNRRYLMEIFEREVQVAKRNRAPISFIMIDLDHFKKINDEYGHKMGDRALECAAAVLKNALRTTDSLGRYGGEEFAVVLPDCSITAAREVAERCREAVEATTVEYNGCAIQLTASVGATTVIDPADVGIDTIIERADQALYKSKGAGRNRVSFFSDKPFMNLVRA